LPEINKRKCLFPARNRGCGYSIDQVKYMMNKWIFEDKINSREEETISEAEKNDEPIDRSLRGFPNFPKLINKNSISPDHG